MLAPTIDEILLADQPGNWRALGFAVEGRLCQIGAVRLRFALGQAPADDGTPSEPSPGVLGWSLRDVRSSELDGLPTSVSTGPVPAAAPIHPNGVLAIDHVVAFSPDLDRTVAALRAAGLDLRRIREQPTPAGAPRQAFFRLGPVILEVVQKSPEAIHSGGGPDASAHFWGLALLTGDLERTAAAFAPHVSHIRPAVQPGRRIATVRRSAGLAVPLALMSPREAEVPA